MQDEYGEFAIETASKFFTVQVDQTKPSFVTMDMQQNVLQDETSYLQYG